MSTSTQPTTFLDIYTDIANRVRADTNITDTLNQAKRYANIGLHDMHIGSSERFPWAERDAILVTHPLFQFDGSPDGGVYIQQGATAASFTKAAATAALGITETNSVGQVNMRPGGKLVVSGDSEPYEITSVVLGAFGDLTGLDSVYTNSTTAVETGFTYFEDEYDLASDFLRPVDVQRFASGAIPIQLIGRTKFRNRYPKVITTGLPTIATIMDREVGTITATTGAPADTLPRRRIRFWPAPGDIYRIPYSYVTGNLATSSTGVAQTQMSADTDEPIVPLRYRMAIIYHALYSWYRDRKDDVARAKEAKAQYEELVGRVRSDVEVGQSRPQIRPALRSYRRSAKRPWGGGGSRRFDLGNFDYLGD
jgi:hypothetical protein